MTSLRRLFGDEEDYFYYLLGFLDGDERYRVFDYIDILHELFTTPFIWKVADDANRARDGIALRDRFEDESGEHLYMNRGCSMLEMMVALAVRMEDDILFDPDFGDRTAVWFWDMMEDSGLIFYDLDHFSVPLGQKCPKKWSKNPLKNFDYGTLFRSKSGQNGPKVVSLWYKMNEKVKEMLNLDQFYENNH